MKVVIPKLLTWYLENHRDLPWRNTLNPYHIWVSEMILQQTRVDQGLPYYYRFLDKFPQITDLAGAHEDDILAVWQGLGYYARARNMHRTAKFLVNECGGEFPKNFENLKKLKGIGPYTAAAIASFAFKIPVPAVDGNVKRVVARFYGIDTNIESPAFFKLAFELLLDVIPTDSADTFNQAMMELGALICKPQSPHCIECPLLDNCSAFAFKRTAELPVRIKKIKITQRFIQFVAFQCGDEFLLRQRPSEGIWGGLFEYPHFDISGETGHEFPYTECPWDMPINRPVLRSQILHKLSHQHLNASLWICEVEAKTESLNTLGKWVRFDELKSFPLHKLMRNFVSL